MLTCKELTEVITDYLENRLGFAAKLRIQFHLGMCRRCRAYLRQMKVTREMLGSLPPLSLPPDLRDELAERFRSLKPSPDRRRPDGTNTGGF